MDLKKTEDNSNQINWNLFKIEFFKYLSFWKIILSFVLISIISAFFYIRYTPQIFSTQAKIKILDKKDNDLALPSAVNLFKNNSINIENEIQVLSSQPILEKVVKDLELSYEVFVVGKINTSLTYDYPFKIQLKKSYKKIESDTRYEIYFEDNQLIVYNIQNNKKYSFSDFTTKKSQHDLPFEIYNLNIKSFEQNKFEISIYTLSNIIDRLKSQINVSTIGKESDIISVSINNSNKDYSEKVINKLLDVFNQDGINDRQMVHKRTIDFVNERYLLLSIELDSIELQKQIFKSNNEIISFKANSQIALESSLNSNQRVFQNNNQISLSNMILSILKDKSLSLIPANLGIDNIEINSLINEYNQNILLFNKIEMSAGLNNPGLRQVKNVISSLKSNILFSLEQYINQLIKIQDELEEQNLKANNDILSFPEKEKKLRSIERNQQIKEALYLFLLQKREESEVSFAITEPSIKIIEYAITNKQRVYPNSNLVYLSMFLFGLLFPILILYIIFALNTKINSRDDIENSNYTGDIIAEVPFFENLDEQSKIFSNPEDRSIISEAYRMLMSNVRYLLNLKKKSNTILITSSIKGEGKTLTALNLSLSFASLNKKVLLIGSDLRNPQIHKYLNMQKDTPGLVNFLINDNFNWQKSVIKHFDKMPTHDILLSGAMPPNPLFMINNGNFDILVEQAKKVYDYVIIDSAPTLLVADTRSIFHLADAVIYVTRCNVTDKDILNHIEKASHEIEANLAIALNGIGQANSYGYSYGYRYGYGYSYKYSYNYGYGYGYSSDDDKS